MEACRRLSELTVVDDLAPSQRVAVRQDSDVRVALSSQQSLNVLDIDGLLEQDSKNSDGGRVRSSTVDRTGKVERLPLGRQTNSTGLRSREREPVLLSVLGREQVLEGDGHVSEERVLGEVSVVDNSDGDGGRVLVGDDELVRALPGAGKVDE